MNTTDRETKQLQICFKGREEAKIELAQESLPVHLPEDDGELAILSDSAEQSIFQEDLEQILKEMEAELSLSSEQQNEESFNTQECQERRGGLLSSLFLVLLIAMMGAACYMAVDSPIFGRFVEPSEFYQKKFGDNFPWLKK